MLLVDLIIILSNLKLDKIYCTGAMNQLKMICYIFVLVVVYIKMSYYQFNRQELLQKAKDRYHNVETKRELVNIILKIRKFYKKMQKINTETCQKKKKEAKREYGRNRYINMTEDKKNKLKENQKNYQSSIKNINFFAYINTSQETLKFGYVEVNNKQF